MEYALLTMGLLLALAVLLAGSVVLHERAKEGTAAVPLLLPSSFDGLERDHVYRLWATLDTGYGSALSFDALTDDLKSKIRQLGFSEVLLAVEDPTDPRVWSFVARWGRDENAGVNEAPLHVYTVQPLAGLPESNFPPTTLTLDEGMTEAEAHAVTVALDREQEPSRLDAFSEVMITDFPLSGILLKARADTLRGSPP